MKLVGNVKKELWKEFVNENPKSTIYHTPEWVSVLEKTFDYRPKHLFAIDDSEKILGFIPMFHVKSKIFGSRLSCLPFSHICGFIGEEKVKKEILNEAIEISEKLKSKLEIRDLVDDNIFQTIGGFYTYVLRLSEDLKEIWKKMDKGSVRWAIKKASKEGVLVEQILDLSALREFIELNFITKKNLGVPAHPSRFFENLFKELEDNMRLYLAKFKNEVIGGGLFLYFKDTVLYGYGASNPKYLKLHPNHAILWKAIEDACKEGFVYFDFGRASINESGLRAFKLRWGTEEIALKYSFYPNCNIPLVKGETHNSAIYKMGKLLIKNLPLRFYKEFSEKIVGTIG